MDSLKIKEKGLSSVKMLYLIIGLVVFGLIAINIAVNLIWFEPFIDNLKKGSIESLTNESKRSAENIEKAIDLKIYNINNLAQNIFISESPDFFINRFLKDNPHIKEVSIINLEGQEEKRYSRSQLFREEDFIDFSYFQEFQEAKKGNLFISEVFFTEKAEPYIKIALPIKKLEIGEPQAVLRVVFYLRGLWEEIPKMNFGKTGRISIIDEKGMVIADPVSSRILKETNLLFLRHIELLTKGEPFEGIKYFNEQGVEVVGSGVFIKNLNWSVVAEQNTSELEALINEINLFAFLFLITGIAIVSLLIWLFLIIKHADKELIKKSIILENKNEELEDSKSILEIKVKARTRELEEMAESLEAQIEKRTQELQKRIYELERFHRLTVGRELKMVELKREIVNLEKSLKKKNKD